MLSDDGARRDERSKLSEHYGCLDSGKVTERMNGKPYHQSTATYARAKCLGGHLRLVSETYHFTVIQRG